MFSKTKRHHWIILCLVGLLLVSCASGASRAVSGELADDETGLRLVPRDTDVGVDQVAEVEIRLDNVENLYGLHLSLQFDPSILRVQDADLAQEGIQIVPGGLPAPDFAVRNLTDNEQGRIEYAVVQLGPREPAHGDGLVATIRFQGLKEGESALTFLRAELADPDGQDLPIKALCVSIEVK